MTHRKTDSTDLSPVFDIPALEQKLQEVLGYPVSIGTVDHLEGGSIQENWRLDLVRGDRKAEPFSLVLRQEPESHIPSSLSKEEEGQLLSAMTREGVPVPRFYGQFCLPAFSDQPLIVSDFVSGTTDVETILALDEEARLMLLDRIAEVFAGLHAMSVSGFSYLRVARQERLSRLVDAGNSPIRAYVHAFFEDAFDAMKAMEQDVALLELCREWCFARLSDVEQKADAAGANRFSLSHGDLRTANYLVGQGSLLAVLDWEFAELAPPAVDLGWFTAPVWRYGREDRPAGGLGTLERLFDAYEHCGGTAPDRESLIFWQVIAVLKWLVIAHQQGHRFFHQGSCDPELGLTGLVRPSEAEQWILEVFRDDPVEWTTVRGPDFQHLQKRLEEQLAGFDPGEPGNEAEQGVSKRVLEIRERLNCDDSNPDLLCLPVLERFRQLNQWALSVLSPEAIGGYHCQLVTGRRSVP
ncbi:phosphotransferase family protein [Kiloniella sp. b19]|uniref:phosphotransferase family protein n=1 Tax=Kiloniella sp. GXU_MW_B19 TaxID=3141326 RepID=UPI0031D219BE